ALGQHERALELACGDAAMEIMALLVVLLPPANHQLAFLDRHVELIAREPRDRERDPQTLGLAVLEGNPLDVVGRIAVGALGDAVERTLDLVESEQERAGQRGNSGHGLKALASDFDGALAAPLDRPNWTFFPSSGGRFQIWGPAVKGSRMPPRR